jgi:hypothetical protein
MIRGVLRLGGFLIAELAEYTSPPRWMGYEAIPTCGGEMRWGGRIDLRNFLLFLFSLQPSHSYTHRVRNGLTIAANRNTLFLATISCPDERPSLQLAGSLGKSTEDNPRQPGRRSHVAQTLVGGWRVGSQPDDSIGSMWGVGSKR